MGILLLEQVPMCNGCGDIFKKYAGVIKAAAMTHSNAFVEYADLTQMIFVRLIEWKNKQNGPIDLKPGFFYTVASNLAISEYRKRKNESQLDDSHQKIYQTLVDPKSDSNPEAKLLIEEILAKVDDPRDKDAVFSWYTDEPIEAFADRHSVSKSGASVLRFRAIQRLRHLILALEGVAS